MENTKPGEETDETISELYPYVTNKRPRGEQVKKIIESDVEIEFLEDNENRWDKIFELLESEINAQ